MEIERSFTAFLRMVDYRVQLLETLHGKPAMATVNLFSGGWFTGKPQTRDHSSLLGIRPKSEITAAPALKLHFRHTSAGYILTIKNPGDYYGNVVGTRWLEVFGAKDARTEEPTLFTLVNLQNNPITLDDISTPHTPVSLTTENKKYVGGLKVRGSSYVYLGETEEKSKMTFVLTVVERQAARGLGPTHTTG